MKIGENQQMQHQGRDPKRVKRESWTVRAPFCIDKQKADGFTLDIQEVVIDEIQGGTYMDLKLGSREGEREGKKQWSLEVAVDVS